MPFITNIFKHETNLFYKYNILGPLVLIFIITTANLFNFTIFHFPLEIGIFNYSYGFLITILIFFPFFSLLSFSHEAEHLTLNRLLALPLNEGQLVKAKFMTCFKLLIPILTMIVLWQLISLHWHFFDFGLFLTALISVAAVAFLAAAAAIFFGTIVKALISPLLSLLFSALLIFSPLNFFSLDRRLFFFAKGIINTADLAFFIGIGLIFLGLSTVILQKKRGIPSKKPLLWLALFVLNLAFPLHIDLTFNAMHRPARASRLLLTRLEAPLYLSYYISPQLSNQPAANEVWRILNQFNKFGNVHVNRIITNDTILAESFGFFIQGNNFAGLVIEYQEKFTTFPFLIDSIEVEHSLVNRINMLINGSYRLAVITGQHRSNEMNSLLHLSLQNNFELVTDLSLADGFLVIDESTVSAAMADYLFRQNELGKGLFIAINPIKIELFGDSPPVFNADGALLRELYRSGLALDTALILDPDGLPLTLQTEAGVREEPYPLFVRGLATGNSRSIWHGINIPYSVALATTGEWQPLVQSSAATYMQEGFINLWPANETAPPTALNGPFTLIATRQNGLGQLIVAGSDSLFSDLLALAPAAGHNLAIANLLAEQLTSNNNFTNLHTRFNPLIMARRPFLLNNDGVTLTLRIILITFSSLVIIILFLWKNRWSKKLS
ncbi:MAG: hypothetical protein FWE37_05095 [Spirochaetaceae bacterium]|nr:hypothetical protein [Spirochaetaceae bacterium]